MNRVTPQVVQAKIDQYKPDIVFVDYLQLFDSTDGGKTEVERVKSISRDFKRMAMSNDSPVVALTQATQQSPKDTEEPPMIEQVAWSKSIQHDANLAIAVHKYPDSDIMDIIARKNRHGELFAFELSLDIDRGIVREL
jgi:replicative DNA helicase